VFSTTYNCDTKSSDRFQEICTPRTLRFLVHPPPSPNTTNLGIRWPFHFPALLFPPLSWNSRRLYSVYMEGGERQRWVHRVGRVLSFFSTRWNWDSPTPLAAGECAPPPPTLWSGGGGHTRLRERGWGSPNSDEGTFTVVLFCTLWVGRKGLS
jgi:hypothetical protein